VFAFYNDMNNLIRLSPPAFKIDIMHVSGYIKTDTRIEMSIKLFLFTFHWTAIITEYEANRCFVDMQGKGPFAKWIHRHEFNPHEKGTE